MSVIDDEHDIMSLFTDALSQIEDVRLFGFTILRCIRTFQLHQVRL